MRWIAQVIRRPGIVLAVSAFAVLFSPPSPGQANGQVSTVTLITGDRILLTWGEHRSAQPQPRAGREHIGFVTEYRRVNATKAEHYYVIPKDALSLIGAGKLDRELFNVTRLVQSGYDDGRRNDLPLVITYDTQARALSATATTLRGASETLPLQSINGVATKTAKQNLGTLWDGLTGAGADRAAALSTQSGSIRKVWLDRLYRPVLDRSVPQIGAPAVWQSGYEGDGVTVAVIDTGIDSSHPDLAGRVVTERNFTTEADGDRVGHGTHVASTIAGTGAASSGAHRGVAPRAALISAKVCMAVGCQLSDIIEGAQWAVAEQGAKIVNVSLGSDIPDEPGLDPIEQAVNELTAQYGALFVISAGNLGDGAASIASPGSAEAALTVGAVDRSGELASFSGRGPAPGSYAIKPEITAPGVGIVAARASTGTVGVPVNDFYTSLNGTSMAAPHVAGAAALLSQQHPEWNAEQLKAALISSARANPATSLFGQGAGLVDIAAASSATLSASPGVLSLGIALSPHDGDEALVRTVTYRNRGTRDVTVSLRLEMTAPNGGNAPSGMFVLQPATLTIPAGSTATATLTASTRNVTSYGLFSGRLLATSNDGSVSTPIALTQEDERYEIQLEHIDRDGNPAREYTTIFIPLDKEMPLPYVEFVPGPVSIRVPPGRYAVQSTFNGIPVGTQNVPFGDVVVIKPELVVDGSGPIQLTFDARDAQLLTVAAPKPTAEFLHLEAAWEYTTAWGVIRYGIADLDLKQALYTALLGQSQPALASFVTTQWTDPTGSAFGSDPAHYSASWVVRGGLPSGTKVIPLQRMSVVRASYASSYPGLTRATAVIAAAVLDPNAPTWRLRHDMPLPSRRTEFFYGDDPEVRWDQALSYSVGGDLFSLLQFPTYYPPGRMSFARWNEAPYLPTFQNHNPGAVWSYRKGNSLVLQIPMYGDKGGHTGDGFRSRHLQSVYRNGEKIGETPYPYAGYTVPAEAATYRVESTVSQQVLPYSTQLSAAWTFSSGVRGRGRRADPAVHVIAFRAHARQQWQSRLRFALHSAHRCVSDRSAGAGARRRSASRSLVR